MEPIEIRVKKKNQWLKKQKNIWEKSMKLKVCSLRRSINLCMSCRNDQENRKTQITNIGNKRSDTTRFYRY